ncbi:MAG: flagellar assembly protein FliH [Devosia sp.]|nr:flagellar assembly protein FliH [Devosia sp.]
MSATPARFTFDLDLGRHHERNAMVSESAMSEMLAAARKEGEIAGFAAGEQSATARAAKQLTAAAEQLANKAAAMAASIDDARKQAIAESVTLANAIARKLAATLVAREPTAEIEALIVDCLASLNAVPHLVIRCRPELADAVRDIATQRIAASGFSGRLVVLGDPEIALGDARLEWADGGLARDVAHLGGEIDERIAEYFAARGIASTGPREIEP